MLPFLLRRSFAMLFVLFCVVTLTFFLVRLAPGGPFTRERKLSPAIEAQLLKNVNLSGTLWSSTPPTWGCTAIPPATTAACSRETCRSPSRTTRARCRISSCKACRFPPLSASRPAAFHRAGGLAGLCGRGASSDCHRYRSHVWRAGAHLHPHLCGGAAAGAGFAVRLRWLPVAGWGSPASLLLPAITLSGPYIAFVARLMRSSMLEVIGQDFLRTAYAKGLPARRAIYVHALKVAILPVVSFLGPLAANLLTGSIVVEMIFNIPGMGGFFVNSILNRDIFLLSGVVIVYCTLLVGMNLLVDIAYSALDPRIRIYE